jgi:iron complex outermembrane receptor protein
MQNSTIRRIAALWGITLTFCVGLGAHAVHAADLDTPISFDIAAQPLEGALLELSKQASIQLVLDSSAVAAKNTAALSGKMPIREALNRLLHDTELTYRWSGDHTVTIAPRAGTRPAGGLLTPFSSPSGAPTPRFLLAQAGRASGSGAATSRDGQSTSRASASTDADVHSSDTGAGGETLADIVVTAEKRAQRLIDVPSAITALDGDALRRAGIKTMLDLSYAVPSLVVQDTGGGYQRYFIRGIANGNGATSLVGVYLDEADITNNSNTQLDVRAGDIERVEVLKGPQGTLYGAGSAGGTVRLITHDPDLTQFTASGDLQGYSTRYGAPSEEASGVFNVPLVDNVLGLRFAGTYGNLGGWIDQPAAGLNNINNQDLWDMRIKMLWEPAPETSIKATAEIHRDHGGGTDASADANYNLVLAYDPAARAPFSSDFDIYNLTASYDFSAVNLLSSSTYFDSNTSGVIGLIYAVAPPPAAPFQFLNNPDTRNDSSFSEELRLSSRGATAFHWVAGAFFKNQTLDYNTVYEYSGGGAPPGSGSSPDNEGSKSTSVFADAGYTLPDGLEFGAGIRSFHDDRKEFDGVLHRSGSFHAVDPRLYAGYALTTDIHFYADAADGFRSGGFNGGYGLPETTFAPEKVRSYEAGTKMSLFDKRLSVDLGIFFSKYQNIQIFANTPNGIGELQNGGDAHIWGGDWSFDWQASSHLSLAFSGSRTRSALVSLLPGVAIVHRGDPVDFSTDYTGRLSGTYAFNLAENTPAFARLDYNLIGPSHLTDRSEGGPPILFETDIIRMLNARIGLERAGWGVDLFATNLLNADGVQDTAGAYGFGARPRPRTIGVEIRTSTH